jgi:PAS domain S-box-containing protein
VSLGVRNRECRIQIRDAMNETHSAQPREALQDLNKVIERAKQELEQMMDLTPQVMLLVDGRGIVRRANRALLKFGGFSDFGQVLGQSLEQLFACETPGFFPELLQGGCGTVARATTVKRGDGSRREMSFSLIGPGGESDLHVIMASDVTDERAQQAVLEKKHKIEAATAMVGGLMHNINQPLTVITVSAELMYMAIENGTCRVDDMKHQLEMIMDLAMQVAGVLKQAEHAKDFVTEQYPGPGNYEIVNIPRP